MNRSNVLVEIPAAAGMPCQNCLEDDHDLKFRRFRRVVSYIFAASFHDMAGYFCSSCRLRIFFARQGATLVTGWWGLLSLFIYNPFAILLNFYGLVGAPFEASQLGAIDLDDVHAAASENEGFEDMYASLPTWLSSLSDDEIELVLAQVDYYSVLGVSQEASDQEIKTAYRRQAKRYHPDSGAGDADSDVMVLVIAANQVLGDSRLRYAYDHVDEHLEALAENGSDPPRSHTSPAALECRYCGVCVDDRNAAIAHLESFHKDIEVIEPMSAFNRVTQRV